MHMTTTKILYVRCFTIFLHSVVKAVSIEANFVVRKTFGIKVEKWEAI